MEKKYQHYEMIKNLMLKELLFMKFHIKSIKQDLLKRLPNLLEIKLWKELVMLEMNLIEKVFVLLLI